MKTFRVKSGGDLARDLLAGLVIAIVSVPISMGYAQVAGLPVKYGLYGSLLPILVYSLLTTSPRFVFGVDAAPAALAGALLAELGIAFGSAEAAAVMPVITILTALWLWIFWALSGGRFVKFVSEPVLGGCVSGIACIVILTQLPGLFGGLPGTGRAPGLLAHLAQELEAFHLPSFVLGLGTVILILVSRRRLPRISMTVLLMAGGVLLTLSFHIDRYGVALLPAVEPGLPGAAVSDIRLIGGHLGSLLLSTMTMALVIISETLSSTRAMALQYGEKIDNQREILAYAAGNTVAAIFGSSPVSGSISRTKRANHFHVTSQWMSVSACAAMALILLCFTDVIAYLPVPILTGIVVASLVSMLEFDFAARLWKMDRSKFFIFAGAFLAEFLGLMEGVLVGVALSFASFTMRAGMQPRYFLGCLEGEEGFFALNQTPHARPIEHTVLYQFNGELFFANIDDLQEDLEAALRGDTRLVVVSGVTGVDVTAAERLLAIYRLLRERGVFFFLAGHVTAVNEQLIAFGAEELIQNGAVRARFTEALAAGGLAPPYPLAGREDAEASGGSPVPEGFTWAYGKYAAPRLERLARQLAEEILAGGGIDEERLARAERELAGEYWNTMDEEEFLDLLEMSLAVALREDRGTMRAFRSLSVELMERRVRLEQELSRRGDIAAARHFIRTRLRREADFRRRHPGAAALLGAQRKEYMNALRRENPELAALLAGLAEEDAAERAPGEIREGERI